MLEPDAPAESTARVGRRPASRHGVRHLGAASDPCARIGRDIYAVTAPLVVEAARRVLAGEGDRAGVASVGARFDPVDFLGALAPDHLALG